MRHFFLIIILILGAGIGLTSPVAALTVSPVKLEISGDPGQTLIGELELFNDQEEVKTFYSSFENFEARGESGAPYFTGCAKTSLCTWIKTATSVTLKPGERKDIPYSIEIPKNAETGGHFAAVFWGTSAPGPQVGGQVSIGGRLGILVLLSVSGETKSEGEGLVEFQTTHGKLLSSLPITFVWRFSNQGKGRIKPVGELTIKNIFEGTTAVLDANRGDGNVLPGSVRKFEVAWFEKGQDKLAIYSPPTEEVKEKQGFFATAGNQLRNLAFGLYTAKLNLVYGKDNRTVETSFKFFVIPWQLLSILFVALFIIGFVGIIGLKRYNHWIINKAAQQRK